MENPLLLLPALQRIDTLTTEFFRNKELLTVKEAVNFFCHLKHEVEAGYGTQVDVQIVSSRVLSLLSEIPGISAEQLTQINQRSQELLTWSQCLQNSKFSKKSFFETLSLFQISTAPPIPPSPQGVELPDNLAIGVACLLAGTLLCTIPSGAAQTAGGALIGTGFSFVFQGVKEGERPIIVEAINEPSK